MSWQAWCSQGQQQQQHSLAGGWACIHVESVATWQHGTSTLAKCSRTCSPPQTRTASATGQPSKFGGGGRSFDRCCTSDRVPKLRKARSSEPGITPPSGSCSRPTSLDCAAIKAGQPGGHAPPPTARLMHERCSGRPSICTAPKMDIIAPAVLAPQCQFSSACSAARMTEDHCDEVRWLECACQWRIPFTRLGRILGWVPSRAQSRTHLLHASCTRARRSSACARG